MVSVAGAETVSGVDFVTIVPIDEAFALEKTNAVSFRINSLATVGNQQFATYYNDARRVSIARRQLGSTNWDVFDTLFTDPNSNALDRHDVISFAIDGDGYLHMSWGMHADNLLYTKSSAPVTGGGSIQMIGGSTGNSAALNAMTGTAETTVTYPEFYNLPDGDLLFLYRSGVSGDGDTYLKRYDTVNGAWSAVQSPLFDGDVPGDGIPSVNAYPNNMVVDSQGRLQLTWTSRYNADSPAGESGYQTNHNIYFARSADEGVTWTRQDGTPYALPINEATAQVVVPIPEGSSLINMAGMTVDQNDYPMVATWWAPEAQQGNDTRQYMLSYYDGQQWRISQITNRPPEPKQSEPQLMGKMARPLVLMDKDQRTLVVMRYPEHDANVVTVAYSSDRQHWDFVDLTTESPGTWEPTYDQELWQRENKLDLLYQPVALGAESSTISVLEWDAKAFFDAGLILTVDRATRMMSISNRWGQPVTIEGYSVHSPAGQLTPAAWTSLQDQGISGWLEANASNAWLNELNSTGSSTIGAADVLSLGPAFAPQPVAFGVDAASDIELEYLTVDGQVVRGLVQYVGAVAPNDLVLTVDPATGQAQLKNSSTFNIELEGYSILSSSGALLPGTWDSLDNQNAAGGAWLEANPTSMGLSELNPSGSTLLVGGGGYSLGALFNTSGAQDLTLEFLLAGETTPRQGVVVYGSILPLLMPDVNMDGFVDIFDINLVSAHWGTSSPLGDANKDGVVDIFDVNLISANWSPAPRAAASVPEPSTAMLALAALAACLAPGWYGRNRMRSYLE
jgi:BNR repeat-containing family member